MNLVCVSFQSEISSHRQFNWLVKDITNQFSLNVTNESVTICAAYFGYINYNCIVIYIFYCHRLPVSLVAVNIPLVFHQTDT